MFSELLRAGEQPVLFLQCILLALIPAFAWFIVFGRKHHHKWQHILFTFFAGVASGVIILGYQYFWGKQFDFIFFSLEPQNFSNNIESTFGQSALSFLLIYLSVGFIEEYAKHWVVKKTDSRIFESVDDVIEFSIIAALGFSFLENIGYFFSVILKNQQEDLFSLFLVRSVFVVFIHILCSGIYGYFYGMGHFAKPVLQDMEHSGRKLVLPSFLHRITHLKKTVLFRDEMATLGLLIAMILHGSYDFLLHVETVGNLASYVTSAELAPAVSNIQLHIFVLPVLLVGGFYYLSYLLGKKEDQERFGHLEMQEEYVKS